MKKLILILLCTLLPIYSFSQKTYERDTIPTLNGDLVITFIGHASLQFTFMLKSIYIDPVGQVADYSTFPKADAIIITHEHGDHLDPEAIKTLSREDTEVYLTRLCLPKYPKGKVVGNGNFFLAGGVPIEAVPAYNIRNKRGNGLPFHPKGEGNGYVLLFGQTRVYVAGDSEPTVDMLKLKNIDIAFIPIGEPYTMSPYVAVEAIQKIHPRICYPYHFNNSNPDILKKALSDSGIEVRIRSMK